MKKYIFIISAVFLTLLSCDKDYNSIGSNIIGEGNYNFEKYEAQNIKAYTKPTGAVQSNNLPINALGVFQNPFFGQNVASFVTQVELDDTDPILGYDIEMQSIDSVYLYIPYFSHLDPNNDAVGNDPNLYILDSISGDSQLPFDLKIYESGYYLANNDVNDPTQGQKYFSDEKSTIENNLVSTPLNNSSDVLQNNNFLFSNDEIIIYETDGNGQKVDNEGNPVTDPADWVIKDRMDPGMWLDLDKNFFLNKVLLANSNNLLNNNNFKEYFRGLYFQVNPIASNAAQAQMDFSKGYIVIQYHSKADTNSSTELKKKTLKLNLKGNTINFFENTNSSSYQNILDASDPVNGDATLALRGQVGSGAFIELFDQNELDNLRSKNWLINDAILTINVKDLGQTDASRVYLYDATNNTYLYDYYSDSSTSSDTKLNKYTFGGILEEDTDTNEKKYRIRLTSHIRNLLNTDVDELAENVLLGLVVTEDINTSTLMSVKNSTTFGNESIPTSSIMGPTGTVLYGTNVSASDIAKKIKLDIYYTEPK